MKIPPAPRIWLSAALLAGLGFLLVHAAGPGRSLAAFGCDPARGLQARPPLPPPYVETGPRAEARLVVHEGAGPPLAGVGLNLEPTLWSCDDFRPLLDRELIGPLDLRLVRAGIAQAPWVPARANLKDLNWSVYQDVLDGPDFAPSWQFIEALNARGIEPILSHWGAPGLMTDDGTPTGVLLHEYYEQYAEYYLAAVDYIVNRRGLRILAASPMNEPDCGDGSKIAPEDYPTIVKLTAPALHTWGVRVYGPDTCNAEAGLEYFRALQDDPEALGLIDLWGIHQYEVGPDVETFVQAVRGAGLDQPIYVSEFTAFGYGDLDGAQEANDEMSFLLATFAVLHSHLTSGADAAIYWDGVDYLQEHHAAVTKWGLLRGPSEGFERRKRYYAFQQTMPYLGAGSALLPAQLAGASELLALAVQQPEASDGLALVFVNSGPSAHLTGLLPGPYNYEGFLYAYLTDEAADAALLAPVEVSSGRFQLVIPERAVLTLAERPLRAVGRE